MIEYSTDKIISEVFKSMSDVTRRSLLTKLCQEGSCRVTDLASSYNMSLNAISKHIKILEKCGLVTRKTIGRTHLIEANLTSMHIVEKWLKELKSIWELRLEGLNKLMKMEIKMNDLTVNVSKVIEAPIAKVFDAWLDPSVLAKFMLPMPGMKDSLVKNEAHEGGTFSIIMQAGDDKIPHTGKYIKIDRPNKLVFTWESPDSTDDSIVTIDFTEINDEKTNIELTHVKFIDEQRRLNHEGGWNGILNALNKVI